MDFRPAIEPDVPKTANANQPQPVEVINLDDEQQPPVRNEAKNVVKDLDVLLLNAAGRSVAMDAARNVNTIGRDLVNTGVISEKDMANLESLAKDAAAKLKALDKFSGQGDRHWGNYFIHIDKTTHEVTVKGIDNDASFSATRIGLRKFALDKEKTELYEAQLKDVCQKIHGKKWQVEYDRRVKNDPAIVRNGDTLTIDLAKAKSPEVRMAIIHTLGLQSIALPEEIDKEFYDKLMEMDEDTTKKQAYLNSIAPRVSSDALKATEARLDEAIAHAKTLNKKGKVYRMPQWQNEDNLKGMTNFKSNVTITKSDGSTIKPAGNDIECVRDYNERRCPSFFKREFLQRMFEQPT